MSQYKQSAKVLAVGCVSAAVVPCFVQPLNPTSLAPASRVSQAHVSLSRVEKHNGMFGGVLSGVAPGCTVVAAAFACGRVACGRNRQPAIACNASPYERELGASGPGGFFDPLGFSNGAPPERFRNFREAEIKHGRLAMMAAVGLLAQSVTRLYGFQDAPGGIECIYEEGPARQGLASILIFIGILESFVFNQDPNKEPGNFGDPFRAGEYTMEQRARELGSGRYGMIAFFSIIFFNLTTGKSAAEQLGLGGL